MAYEWRAESPVYMAAAGALQNWSGLQYIHIATNNEK